MPAKPFAKLRIVKLRIWVILLALSVAVSTAQASSIVIRKTATDIFAGADSKMSFSTGQPDTVVDKIIEIKPKWYFSAAGHADISDGRSVNFNVFNTVRLCEFVKGGSLKEFTNLCVGKISSDLRTPLQSVARAFPDLYFREYGNGRILELAFFGQENGSLVAYERALFADLVGTGFTSVKSVDCEATCIALGVYGLFEGFASKIVVALKVDFLPQKSFRSFIPCADHDLRAAIF